MPAKKGDKVEKSAKSKDAKDAKVAKDTKVSKDTKVAKDATDTKVKNKKVEVVSYENSKLAELIEAIANMDKEFKAIKTLVKLVIK